MLDLSKDERCLSVEQKLLDYASAVGLREQARRDFYAGGGERYNLEKDPLFDARFRASKTKKKIFYDAFVDYISKFKNKEDRQQINGHFLWGVVGLYQDGKWRKKELPVYAKDFLNEGLDFIEQVVCKNPMTSYDKIKLLRHITLNKYHKEVNSDKRKMVSAMTLQVLAAFNPHDLRETLLEKIYDNSVSKIKEKRKTKYTAEDMKTFFEMFRIHIQNVKIVHNDTVADYAELYFLMADKTDKELDVSVLRDLATKTMAAQKKEKYCKEVGVLDKKAVCNIFEAYVEHVSLRDSFDGNLAEQMKKLAAMSFDYSDYSTKDVKDILCVLDNPNVGKKAQRAKAKGIENLKADIANIARDNKKTVTNPLSRNDGDYSYDDAIEYADNLFEEVNNRSGKKVKIDVLWDLIDGEEENRKELIADIAASYVKSKRNSEIKSANEMEFHEKMIKFFSSAVSEYYYDGDVTKLQSVIEKEGQGKEIFEDMSRYIGDAKAYKDDWRPSLHEVKPIKFTKNRGE